MEERLYLSYPIVSIVILCRNERIIISVIDIVFVEGIVNHDEQRRNQLEDKECHDEPCVGNTSADVLVGLGEVYINLARVEVGVLVTALLQDGESVQLTLVVHNFVSGSVESHEHKDKENPQSKFMAKDTTKDPFIFTVIATTGTTAEKKKGEEDDEPADHLQMALVSRCVKSCLERVEANLSRDATVFAIQIPVNSRSSPRAVFVLGLE